MRPDDVPQSAVIAALATARALGQYDIDAVHVAAMIAAAADGAAAEDRAEWLATSIAQREQAETSTRAISHQTDLLQQIVDKVLGIGNAPTEYEAWRDAMTLAVHERSYIDAGVIDSRGLLARAGWFWNELSLGRKVPEADAAPGGEG